MNEPECQVPGGTVRISGPRTPRHCQHLFPATGLNSRGDQQCCWVLLPREGGQFEIHHKQQLRTSHTLPPPDPSAGQTHATQRQQHPMTEESAAQRTTPHRAGSTTASDTSQFLSLAGLGVCGQVRNPNTFWGPKQQNSFLGTLFLTQQYSLVITVF